VSDKLITTVSCCIQARDKDMRYLTREYLNFKKVLIPKVQKTVRELIKDPEIKVYAQQKWMLDKNLTSYIKNLPLHPMPFHNQSVWIERTDKGYFMIHFKNKQLPRGEDIVCNLVVPRKYCNLLKKASGKDNSVLGQVELIEDNQYARFNVHITLRLPKPELYEPKGWVGVDVGWNYLSVSAFVSENEIKDITFHGKDFKTRIIQLKYLLKQYQRSNRSWKKWNFRLKHVIKYAVGKVAKEIVEKADKQHAGVAFENLNFRSHTKRFLIPRYKLKCAIKTLCERKGIPFILVNPRNTSLTCNKCGHISKANRNGKTFQCTNCGYICNADFNAAVNIAKKAVLYWATSPMLKPIELHAHAVGELATPSVAYAT